MLNRFETNPILTKHDILPSQEGWLIECVLNPGVFRFEGKTWMLLRVAERPVQTEGKISFPIFKEDGSIHVLEFDQEDPDLDISDPRLLSYKDRTYLTTISHLRLVSSEDGIHFSEPEDRTTVIYGQGKYETYGIEDCRVTNIDGVYHLTYTQVSENGVGVGLMMTRDWKQFQRRDMMLPPHNKDCAIFESKIKDQYFCFHRPSGVRVGGNYIWIASSPDLIHWGNHQCIVQTRPGMWDSARVGAGTSPIRTDEGWLAIYHGADEDHRYCLGALLLDLQNPSKVIARSEEPIMQPDLEYEKNGFFSNVIFTNGHIVQDDMITMYYGAADEVICGATLSVSAILESLHPVKVF